MMVLGFTLASDGFERISALKPGESFPDGVFTGVQIICDCNHIFAGGFEDETFKCPSCGREEDAANVPVRVTSEDN